MATKWGIISAGKISHDFVACLRSLPPEEHQVVAIAARKLEAAQEFSKLHLIPNAYGSYEELARNLDVEVVYVGTINPFHFNVAKLMLEAGKHVLMEKPMTLTLQDTQKLIKLAREKKLFLMEAVWSRFLPAYQQLKKELELKTIGDVKHVHATFGIPVENVSRVTKKELGGGTILDLGIYTLNVVNLVFGRNKPEKIAAAGHLNEDGVDVSMGAALTFKNGCMATVSTSAIVNLPCEAYLSGTKGSIKIPFPMWCSTKLITPNKEHEFILPETVVPCNYNNSSGLRYEAMEVRRCLKEGLTESPTMNLDDSEYLAELMEEISQQIGVKWF